MKSTILGIYNPKQPGSVILGLPHHSASFPSFIHYTQTATQKGSADDVFPFWVEGVGPARLHRRQGLGKMWLVGKQMEGSVSAAWSGHSDRGSPAGMRSQRQQAAQRLLNAFYF